MYLEVSNDSTINSKLTFDMTYETTPLSLYIKGGNRMTGYTDSLVLEGFAKDLDETEGN